jgi:hypothetical protein
LQTHSFPTRRSSDLAGTGNADGSLGTTDAVGRYRTYTRIEGAFSWEKLAEAMRAGRNVATSGPFVLFDVGGEGPGAELPADGRPRKATLKAWSSPLPGETLTTVQVVRNGEVVRAWDLRQERTREWEISFDVSDSEFAWYCVRALSECRDTVSVARWGPQLYELAVANPVYFLPAGFRRPGPAEARVSLKVTDEAGRATQATVSVHDGAGEVGRYEMPASGEAVLTVAATASLVVSAQGFQSAQRNLYMDCPELFEYCRNINMVWPSFYSPEVYTELRRRLADLKLSVRLAREA